MITSLNSLKPISALSIVFTACALTLSYLVITDVRSLNQQRHAQPPSLAVIDRNYLSAEELQVIITTQSALHPSVHFSLSKTGDSIVLTGKTDEDYPVWSAAAHSLIYAGPQFETIELCLGSCAGAAQRFEAKAYKTKFKMK